MTDPRRISLADPEAWEHNPLDLDAPPVTKPPGWRPPVWPQTEAEALASRTYWQPILDEERLGPALWVRRQVFARLSLGVGRYVNPTNVFDSLRRPTAEPCIVLGETQEVDDGGIADLHTRIFQTLHVWRREPVLEGVVRTVAAVRTALCGNWSSAPFGAFRLVGSRIVLDRCLADPDGETGHGIVTLEAVILRIPNWHFGVVAPYVPPEGEGDPPGDPDGEPAP